MKRGLLIIGVLIATLVAVCGISYLTDKPTFNKWTINAKSENEWIDFKWVDEELSGKRFQKTAMVIPVQIEGIPYNLIFQFDIGSHLTMIYEKSFNSIVKSLDNRTLKIQKLKSHLQFWDRNKSVKNLTLKLGDTQVSTTNCFVNGNYGQEINADNYESETPINLGTIGADIFQNKVLIIDYPEKRFSIRETVPEDYKKHLVDIEIDDWGKPILPMELNGNHYRIAFDNGSSIFPLITLAKNIDKFTTNSDVDTVNISSWGQRHNVTGKIITDTFKLGGQPYSNVKIYTNHTGLGIDKFVDGMTGNSLFWDRILIVDFKNKKFGLR